MALLQERQAVAVRVAQQERDRRFRCVDAALLPAVLADLPDFGRRAALARPLGQRPDLAVAAQGQVQRLHLRPRQPQDRRAPLVAALTQREGAVLALQMGAVAQAAQDLLPHDAISSRFV